MQNVKKLAYKIKILTIYLKNTLFHHNLLTNLVFSLKILTDILALQHKIQFCRQKILMIRFKLLANHLRILTFQFKCLANHPNILIFHCKKFTHH